VPDTDLYRKSHIIALIIGKVGKALNPGLYINGPKLSLTLTSIHFPPKLSVSFFSIPEVLYQGAEILGLILTNKGKKCQMFKSIILH
jgi:hypothetical protein